MLCNFFLSPLYSVCPYKPTLKVREKFFTHCACVPQILKNWLFKKDQNTMSANRAMRRISEAASEERKKTVQAEFLQKQKAYQAKKAEEAKAAAVRRMAAEKKRNQPEEARTEFGKFRMTAQERTELQAVCKTLNVSESQFLRDSVREAVMLLYNQY